MSSVMKGKSAIKAGLLTTNHSIAYGAKLKVNEVPDFEAILSCNRKFILDI